MICSHLFHQHSLLIEIIFLSLLFNFFAQEQETLQRKAQHEA